MCACACGGHASCCRGPIKKLIHNRKERYRRQAAPHGDAHCARAIVQHQPKANVLLLPRVWHLVEDKNKKIKK